MFIALEFERFFIENSKDIIFLEVATVSEYLKNTSNPIIKLIRQTVAQELPLFPFFKQGVGKKLFNNYISFFTYQVFIDPSFNQHVTSSPISPNATKIQQDFLVRPIPGIIRNMWGHWGDYIAAMGGNLKSKINLVSYTANVIDQEVEDWHQDMAARQQGIMPSEQYEVAIELDNIGWKGWKWVDLQRGSCTKEAKAMGHCGNAGETDGDNIFSLRDPEGYAHLTFIVNNTFLGESKGRGNSKPSPRYHPAIIEFLESQYVNAIMGGGYKPENNFELSDLNEKQQELLLKMKPNLNDAFDYITNSANEEQIKTFLEQNLRTEVQEINGSQIVLEICDDLPELHTRLKNISNKKIDDFSSIEEPYDSDIGPIRAKDYIYYIPKNLMTKIEKYLEKSMGEDEEYEDNDVADLMDENDDISDALRSAVSTAIEVGSSNEAYKSVVSQLESVTDNGFYVDMKHPYKISIELSSLKYLKKHFDSGKYDSLNDAIDISFTYFYNGYYDFDKDAFVERLEEALAELEI